jgi:twinkle protein
MQKEENFMKKPTEKVIQFAAKRGISPKTLEDLKVEGGIAQYGDRSLESIVFGYYNLEGKRVNYKARAISEKIFKQEKGGEQRFYNGDNVLNSKNLKNNTIYVVEGEMDALALYEANFGIDCILSVPTGAVASPTEQPEASRKYQYVLDALDQGLDQANCFVLLTDNDQPGLALRQDLASILGHGKCKYFDWTDGIKDVNEALLKWGKDNLKWTINEGLCDYPLEGIYSLDDIPQPPKIKLYNPMFGFNDKVLIGSGMLSTLCSFPGHGKTTFSTQLWLQIAKEYKINIGMYSGETRIKPYIIRNLRTFYHKKLEWEQSDKEKHEADEFIREHFVFLNHPNNSPDFDWICDKVQEMKARYGISAFILDPWNKLNTPEFGKISETAWIGKCLDHFSTLAKLLDIHIMVQAHPAKPDMKHANAPPTPYQIAGSAHWYNKPDHIFSLWREKFENDDGSRNTSAILTVCKTRYEELGYPRVLKIHLDLKNGCFKKTDEEKEKTYTWQERKDLE